MKNFTNSQFHDLVQKIVASDRFTDDWYGISSAISGTYAIVGPLHEDQAVNGWDNKINSRSAYIYQRNGEDWEFEQKLTSNNRYESGYFGARVSISEGTIVIASALEITDENGENYMIGAGGAYIFETSDILGIDDQNKKLHS